MDRRAPGSVAATPEALATSDALRAAAEAAERRGDWGVAASAFEQLLRHAGGETPSTSAQLVRRIARCHAEAADFEAALESLAAAEHLSLTSGDALGVAHAGNLRGIVAQMSGDIALAERLYIHAREQASLLGAEALIAMLDQNLGTIANIRGDLDVARRRYEASLRRYRRLGMEAPVGHLLNNLGMLYTDLGAWREAENTLSEARRLAAEQGDAHARLRADANRVELYVSRKRYRKARQLCRRLLAAQAEYGGAWVGETYKHLGVIARETGDPADAERNFTQALGIAEQRHDQLLAAETLREIALLHERRRRRPEMLAALTRAHALFDQLRARNEVGDIEHRLHSLEQEFLGVVARWGASIETADSYTMGHSERVAQYACALFDDTAQDPAILLWFRMGALLHDVGKITVPAAILRKAGALTPDELAVMREHPVRGEQLLADTEFPWDVRPMVRHHHERWDGTGYPDRLAGEAIPVAARILCIADVFDALTSSRSYRTAYDVPTAVAIMRAESARAFDPDLLRVFLTRTLPSLDRQAAHGTSLRLVRDSA